MSSSPYIDNLNFIRKDNLNKIIYYSTSEHNSKNKFEYLIEKIKGNIDFLMVSENKLNGISPTDQFIIYVLNAHIRIYPNMNEGGITLFVKDGITAKFLSFATSPTGYFLC